MLQFKWKGITITSPICQYVHICTEGLCFVLRHFWTISVNDEQNCIDFTAKGWKPKKGLVSKWNTLIYYLLVMFKKVYLYLKSIYFRSWSFIQNELNFDTEFCHTLCTTYIDMQDTRRTGTNNSMSAYTVKNRDACLKNTF